MIEDIPTFPDGRYIPVKFELTLKCGHKMVICSHGIFFTEEKCPICGVLSKDLTYSDCKQIGHCENIVL